MLAAVVSTQPGAAILTDADHAGLERTKLRLKIGPLRPHPFDQVKQENSPGRERNFPHPHRRYRVASSSRRDKIL